MITINLWTVLQVVLIALMVLTTIGTVLLAFSKESGNPYAFGFEIMFKALGTIIGIAVTLLLGAVYGGIFIW